MSTPERVVGAEPVAACFITWIQHRRTRELCTRLGIELAELTSARRGLARYLTLVPRSMRYLLARRPKILLVQCPSMVLALLTVLLRPLLRYHLIFDAHNEAVEPYLHPSAPVRIVSRWLIARADCVVVTNGQLARSVAKAGGNPFVLGDPVPSVPVVTPKPLTGEYRVAVISTFAQDEPFEAVLDAAKSLPDHVHFYVTGDSDKLTPSVRRKIRTNMTLTGYLDEHAYWELLVSCNAIIDLTTMPDCLVCGAYEAVAVGKPLILSRNAASLEVFGGRAELVDNTPTEIAGAVMRLQSVRAQGKDLAQRREDFDLLWAQQAEALRQIVSPHRST